APVPGGGELGDHGEDLPGAVPARGGAVADGGAAVPAGADGDHLGRAATGGRAGDGQRLARVGVPGAGGPGGGGHDGGEPRVPPGPGVREDGGAAQRAGGGDQEGG